MPGKLPIIEKIERDLAELKRELSIELPRQLEEARAHGDLKENAEYHAAKERQGMLNARIGALENRLAKLSMYSIASIPKGVVGYGSRVEIEDAESGESFSYELVFAEESDPARGLISISSPTGQAMLRREVGHQVTVVTPSGKRSFEIVDVVTIHERLDKTD
jgi:transcription elongation factor GreA